MAKLCNIENCTGCTACVSICPKHAITMVKNNRGFLYPKIDEEKCINCGLCSKVSHQVENYMKIKESNNNYHAFACKSKNNVVRKKSQSGALFYELASFIIKNNGVVYGALYNNNFVVKHDRIDNLKDLDKLRESKYVQSNLGSCFLQVYNDLQSGKKVLFSGTPCQISGIYSYLGNKKLSLDNFYTCDLICHGVPSPEILKKYLNFMKEKYQSDIKNVNLRDKNVAGWKNHSESIEFINGEKYIGKIYTELFYSNLTLRKCCENCQYTSKLRVSDITMADCWGIEKIKDDLWNDNLGISLAIISTSKGLNLFNEIKPNLDIFEIDYSKYEQPQLLHSSLAPKNKDKFWQDYNNLKFASLLKKYTPYGGILFKIKKKLSNLTRRN